MFEKENYDIIGKITRTHGYDGSIRVHFSYPVGELEFQRFLFLSIHNKPVPFCIESSEQIDEDVMIFKLEDIDSKEQARELCGKDVYYEKNLLSYDDNGLYRIEALIGFTVLDQNNKNFGVVMDIYDNKAHYLLKTNYNEEALIPFHEDLIVAIDEEQKTITLEISEGLLD